MNPRRVTVVDLSWRGYRLPLTAPLFLGGRRRTCAQGLLLLVRLADGRCGVGETAPLPGFSPESLHQCRQALLLLAAALRGRAVEVAPEEFRVEIEADHTLPTLPPALRFGLETAIHRAATPPTTPWRVPVNALVTAGGEDPGRCAARLRAEGYRAVKIKVGAGDPNTEVEWVNDLAAALPPAVGLRLDANRRWREDQADAFAARLRAPGLEYIEEPLPTVAGSVAWQRRCGLPLALDESLAALPPGAVLAEEITALVLKPTLLGGLAACRAWFAEARRLGRRVTLSACLEAGPAATMIAGLAAAYTPAVPAGLDPLRRIRGTPAWQAPVFSAGELCFTSASGWGNEASGFPGRAGKERS